MVHQENWFDNSIADQCHAQYNNDEIGQSYQSYNINEIGIVERHIIANGI